MTMITLRLAALVSAVVTVTLNAVHGYKASAIFEFAIMLATLQAALDIAKCSLIPASVHLWRAGSCVFSLFSLLLFFPLFLNSIGNAVSQVALTRDAGKATAVADAQTRTRAEATHKRLTSELAILQASPTFAATAACSMPKSTPAKTFCENVAATKRQLADAEATLGRTSAADPEAPVTLLAAVTGHSPQTLTFTLAVVPVLLAELVGSLGFVIASVSAAQPVNTPSETPRKAFWHRWRARAQRTPETDPARPAEASTTPSMPALKAATPSTPTIAWPKG